MEVNYGENVSGGKALRFSLTPPSLILPSFLKRFGISARPDRASLATP